jgi:hypothetical protein
MRVCVRALPSFTAHGNYALESDQQQKYINAKDSSTSNCISKVHAILQICHI